MKADQWSSSMLFLRRVMRARLGTASLFALALLSASVLASASISVTSPANATTCGSPVHFAASATSGARITGMKVYVDTKAVFSTSSASIDTNIALATGSHAISIQAWDSTGAVQIQRLTITVGAATEMIPPSSATVFTRIEEMSGWQWCTDCAGAGGNAVMNMTHASSPSLDGLSGQFFVGGSTPWSHALYHRRISDNDTATNFVMEFDYYFKDPAASSAMEFSVNQLVGKNWYRWDTQCSYLSGVWKVWDGAGAKWINTSIACFRPPAYQWNHVAFEGKRSNGKTVFVSITLNGQKSYVNKAVGPTYLGYSDPNVGIHFQLNGDVNQTDYFVWGDRFKLTYW